MKDVIDWLDTVLEAPNLPNEMLYNAIPLGWHFFLDQIIRFRELVNLKNPGGCTIQKAYVDKGLLRIEGVCSHSVDRALFRRLVQSMARDSATACMVCDRFARRRKLEVKMPALCPTHYMEYVTYLADNSA